MLGQPLAARAHAGDGRDASGAWAMYVLWTCITYDYNTVLICALNLLRREPKVEMSTSPADGCETDAKPRAGTYEHSLVARRRQ